MRAIFFSLLLGGCATMRGETDPAYWYGSVLIETAPPGQPPRAAFFLGKADRRWPKRRHTAEVVVGQPDGDHYVVRAPHPGILPEIWLYRNGQIYAVTFGKLQRCRIFLYPEVAVRGREKAQVRWGGMVGHLYWMKSQVNQDNLVTFRCPSLADTSKPGP